MRAVGAVVGRALASALLAMLVVAPSALATGGWRPIGSLTTARISPTLKLLQNGDVLAVGGLDSTGKPLASAELYGAAAQTWGATGSLGTGRAGPTVTLLQNGKVLVAGGSDSNGALKSAELYDPAAGTWSPTGSLGDARQDATATMLPDGKVLVAGGNAANAPLLTAELYDPATGTWTPTGSLGTARGNAVATLLQNGKVLVAGGQDIAGALADSELYDPAAGTWSPTGSLGTARIFASATALKNGKVLVNGGLTPDGPVASSELYDPATGTWSATGSLGGGPRVGETATLLGDGTVLVAGGQSQTAALASAELYDPAAGTWSATGSLSGARVGAMATLLPDGKVMVAGGATVGGGPPVALQSAELYNPTAAQPSLLLTAPAGGTVGEQIDGSSLLARLASGLTPTGTVTFEVFGPQPSPPSSCSTGAVPAGTVTVSGDGTYSPAAGFTPSRPGTYWWHASYGGDTWNNRADSTCGPGMAETVVSAPVPQAPAVRPPVLSGLRIAPKAFPTVAPRRSKTRTRTRLGAQITYTDSTTATAALSVFRSASGVRSGKRCVAPTRGSARRGARRCTRTITVATFKHADVAGVNKIAFSGKFRGRPLAPGRYVLAVSATNSAGRSAVVRAKFSVRK